MMMTVVYLVALWRGVDATCCLEGRGFDHSVGNAGREESYNGYFAD